MPRRILLVDSDAGELGELGRVFEQASPSCRLETVTDGRMLLAQLRASDHDVDLVLVDEDLGDGERDGLALLAEVRAVDPDVPVVLVAAQGDVDRARRAIEAGASDFLVRGDQLGQRVSTQLRKVRRLVRLLDQNRALRQADRAPHRIVGSSRAVAELKALIARVAPVPRPVLVLGERGPGKERVARAIHAASGRRGAFVVVNCAAFSETLLESELFGHERGAFTGADHLRRGKFELASGGTLFLDEIGNMSLAFQQKILRVVEYARVLRVGGADEVAVDVRIVAATNADLQALMRGGAFLRDLYDRLAFEVLRVAPLRERPQDIGALAAHFMEAFMHEVPELAGKRLSDEALALLADYPFPGNVRELKTIIERAVYRDTTFELTPEDVGPLRSASADGPGGAGGSASSSSGFKAKVDAYEKQLIDEALADAGGNQAAAARALELSYHQFRYYLKKHSSG
ncbi:MAG: sigma-54-dependent Fis family transcriptional regulator [Myxococcales bacterium]|nr:sigma-54-dependent Fis family transcriptional regulator [Myxococcales bacterium]